jgi:uncharacterized protein (TIGR03435 family)
MNGNLGWIGLAALVSGLAFGQSGPAPARFEIADVHVTPKTEVNTFMGVNPPRNGRYEFHSASMIDLIQTAYGVSPDHILGGPSWLEMDRFDVIALVPAGTREQAMPGSPPGALSDAVMEMFQTLLADRFRLKLHKEVKPLPGFALTVSRKLQLKEGDGSGDTGCRMLAPEGPTDTTVRYACRNISMEALAAVLPRLRGLPFNAVVDKTELKGSWNFDVKWSLGSNGAAAGDAAVVADAIEKQLGLKLEQQAIPTEVTVVDSADNVPTANAPGVTDRLPIAPQPTAFEVATMKPTDPDYTGVSSNAQPNGRWTVRGQTLVNLIVRAFSASYAQMNADLIVGMPDWARTARFDITAQAPRDAPANARIGPMIRSLLEDRLKLQWHTEERPVSGYVLVATKPKMKKADPASRTHCILSVAAAGSPPGALTMTCQNITMAQFADQIHSRVPGPGWPVLDSTGIEGGWDFALTYVRSVVWGWGGEVAQGAGAAPVASDPGGGLTIFEALEKQLGLKLESQKRPMAVTVIDHLEQKVAEN